MAASIGPAHNPGIEEIVKSLTDPSPAFPGILMRPWKENELFALFKKMPWDRLNESQKTHFWTWIFEGQEFQANAIERLLQIAKQFFPFPIHPTSSLLDALSIPELSHTCCRVTLAAEETFLSPALPWFDQITPLLRSKSYHTLWSFDLIIPEPLRRGFPFFLQALIHHQKGLPLPEWPLLVRYSIHKTAVFLRSPEESLATWMRGTLGPDCDIAAELLSTEPASFADFYSISGPFLITRKQLEKLPLPHNFHKTYILGILQDGQALLISRKEARTLPSYHVEGSEFPLDGPFSPHLHWLFLQARHFHVAAYPERVLLELLPVCLHYKDSCLLENLEDALLFSKEKNWRQLIDWGKRTPSHSFGEKLKKSFWEAVGDACFDRAKFTALRKFRHAFPDCPALHKLLPMQAGHFQDSLRTATFAFDSISSHEILVGFPHLKSVRIIAETSLKSLVVPRGTIFNWNALVLDGSLPGRLLPHIPNLESLTLIHTDLKELALPNQLKELRIISQTEVSKETLAYILKSSNVAMFHYQGPSACYTLPDFYDRK